MDNNPLPNLDASPELREKLLAECRLAPGEVWECPESKHRVGCLDAADSHQVSELAAGNKISLAVHDPPYNLVVFEERTVGEFIDWCKKWIANTVGHLAVDASVYFWLGADQNNGFQPLPEFMIMMRDFDDLSSRSFITMRNQRGYGTQKNWMAVRQECLYYTMGNPVFNVQYTDIPKVLKGYYKEVGGNVTENIERSKSENIRASNIWIDVQQVFYRMQENVSGCYAQKPLKSIERLVLASSNEGDVVADFFAHAGTTLIAAEKHGRRCITCDIDPIYCEMTIRRLEHYRETGNEGWQNGNAFKLSGDSLNE